MDHHFQVGAKGVFEGFKDKYHTGRSPNGIYIPRFRNIEEKQTEEFRGYGYQGDGFRNAEIHQQKS